MSWHLAPSLSVLRSEVNTLWPGRSKVSDGTIGDAAHSARTSDHNPNARRSVNAIDITRSGIDPARLISVAITDSRTNYVIFDRQIWSRSRGFVPRRYTGANPHTGHVHISIRQARDAEQDTRPWGLAASTTTPAPGLPGAGHDNRTDLERLLDSMTKEELEALIYEQANKAVKDNLNAIGGVVYTKTAEVARDREKRDGDIAYVKAAEVARDSRNATADAIADRLRTKLGLDTTAQG